MKKAVNHITLMVLLIAFSITTVMNGRVVPKITSSSVQRGDQQKSSSQSQNSFLKLPATPSSDSGTSDTSSNQSTPRSGYTDETNVTSKPPLSSHSRKKSGSSKSAAGNLIPPLVVSTGIGSLSPKQPPNGSAVAPSRSHSSPSSSKTTTAAGAKSKEGSGKSNGKKNQRNPSSVLGANAIQEIQKTLIEINNNLGGLNAQLITNREKFEPETLKKLEVIQKNLATNKKADSKSASNNVQNSEELKKTQGNESNLNAALQSLKLAIINFPNLNQNDYSQYQQIYKRYPILNKFLDEQGGVKDVPEPRVEDQDERAQRVNAFYKAVDEIAKTSEGKDALVEIGLITKSTVEVAKLRRQMELITNTKKPQGEPASSQLPVALPTSAGA